MIVRATILIQLKALSNTHSFPTAELLSDPIAAALVDEVMFGAFSVNFLLEAADA